MINLAAPWVLLLLPLPLIIYYFLPAKQQERGAIAVPFYKDIQTLTPQQSITNSAETGKIIRACFMGFIWCLLLLAAAKPQWVGHAQSLPNSGRDLLLAVDISDSMEERDMEINGQSITRLIAVKEVVSEFIERRKGDRIGLVLFGSNAYLQAPLTFDTETVKQFLEEAQLGFAGPKTAIGDAIGLSVKRLKERSQKGLTDSKEQVIILLTDGANTAGEVEPLQAAKLAAQTRTKIYTIGIGAEEMIVRGFFGNRRVNPSAALDEKTLTTIAQLTNGKYFRARNTSELNQIYHELDQLEPVDQAPETLRPVRSLFMWPLGLALLLSLAYSLVLHRVYITQQSIALIKRVNILRAKP